MEKKYLTEENILFVASIATNIESGFHLLTAIELAIDDWYLKTPLADDYKYRGTAFEEFCNKVLGKRYLLLKETIHSYALEKALLEFFNEYIAPKYKLIAEFVYHDLDTINSLDADLIYQNDSEIDYQDFKIEHQERLIDLIRYTITDWNFGFEEQLNSFNNDQLEDDDE